MNRYIKQIFQVVFAVSLLMAFSAPMQIMAQKPGHSSISDESLIGKLPGFKNGYSTVNGVRIHYVKGGTGKVLVLLSGWPQTWWSFHKMMPALQQHYTVIAVDYRGMGTSGRPDSGYDKKTIAGDVAGLLKSLGYQQVFVAGHDIGAQVAFSLAANYPELVEKLVMIDVPHPDETFAAITMLPALGTPTDKLDPGRPYIWWFAFNQLNGLPEDLVAGHAAVFQKAVFHYLLKDDNALSPLDREVYAAAYNSRAAIHAGNAWYQAFPQDIEDYKGYAVLKMPVLGIGGPGYDWLKYTLPKKAVDVRVVKVENSGHFLPEEQPDATVKEMEQFLN